MVLLHGGDPGIEKIAASWAEARGVNQVICRPDWNAHGKAAPFRRNDELLNFLPKGVIAFPGSGITGKARLKHTWQAGGTTPLLQLPILNDHDEEPDATIEVVGVLLNWQQIGRKRAILLNGAERLQFPEQRVIGQESSLDRRVSNWAATGMECLREDA